MLTQLCTSWTLIFLLFVVVFMLYMFFTPYNAGTKECTRAFDLSYYYFKVPQYTKTYLLVFKTTRHF